MAKRVEFSRADKGHMIRRASDAKGRIHCEGCGIDVTGKAIEFDHVLPEGLVRVVHPDRPLTPEDGKLLGKECCHRGPDGKTARDVEMIARAKRLELRRAGPRIRSAGFAKAPPRHTATRPLERKS